MIAARVVSRIVVAGLALTVAGCSHDPISPAEWVTQHAPPPVIPSPPPPSPVDTATLPRYASFWRATAVNGDTIWNGYSFGRDTFYFEAARRDDDYSSALAVGDFTVGDTAIVLRLVVLEPVTGARSSVFTVSSRLVGDTLRVSYPDSMSKINPLFTKQDYPFAGRNYVQFSKAPDVLDIGDRAPMAAAPASRQR